MPIKMYIFNISKRIALNGTNDFFSFLLTNKRFIHELDFTYCLNYKDKCYKRFADLNGKNKNKFLSFTYEEDQQSKPAI